MYFFPNPRDGSLFSNSRNGLKKLKATIPSIALSSPTVTKEKLIYAGSKIDSWIDVDLNDGRILAEMGPDVCSMHDIIIGPHKQIPKIKYNIIVRDQETLKCKSNITYSEYHAHGSVPITNYDLRHFSSNFDGSLATFQPESGELLWINNFGGIVVNIFIIDDLGLINVPFITFEHEAFKSFVYPKTGITQPLDFTQKDFQSMVYVHKFDNGYYCLPILIEKQAVWQINNYARLTDNEAENQNAGIVMEYSSFPTYDLYDLFMPSKPDHNANKTDIVMVPVLLEYFYAYFNAIFASFVSILIASILSCYFSRKNEISMKCLLKREIDQIKKFGESQTMLIDASDEDPDAHRGHIRVGKLFYDPAHVLGTGCDGTVVFKGRFDRRDVAIKRLLKHDSVLFEREIKLLIDCDLHPNVCRYFCTESCNQFLYIALQYCMGTLQDLVQGTIKCANLTWKSCLEQTALGLLHLHSLKIVHRDIKPQNILITFSLKNAAERIVISDFGLCRDVEGESMFFSRRSGYVGTEGWMAPEMMQNDVSRVSSAVDIFSLGCVFYYVLSGGNHPFGDSFRRQAHIQEDVAIFDRLSPEHDNMAVSLIRKMVSHKPSRRPTAQLVVSHPFFWEAAKILSFFLETSDRIEKLDAFDPIVRRLETNNSGVIKESWIEHICVALKSDLGRFRTYKGRHLRDLLRAIRNKKNHYMELPADVKEALGQIPGEFVKYFTNRFPFLLIFVYEAMEMCADEHNFRQYYCTDK